MPYLIQLRYEPEPNLRIYPYSVTSLIKGLGEVCSGESGFLKSCHPSLAVQDETTIGISYSPEPSLRIKGLSVTQTIARCIEGKIDENEFLRSCRPTLTCSET